MGKHIHLLSETDDETRTATCANCGPVQLVSDGKGHWRCKKKKAADEAAYRKRHRVQHAEYAKEYYVRTGGLAQRKSTLKQYDLTPEQYDAMVVAQGGVCLLCHKPPPEGQRLRVDHSHVTKRNRGLLCNNCNRGFGLLGDDVEVLLRAIKYLS
jgi:hypothetical protein